jgi:esterase/lipase
MKTPLRWYAILLSGAIFTAATVLFTYELVMITKTSEAQYYDEPTAAYKHLIVMIHGMGGNPEEFHHLYPYLNQSHYNIAIPYYSRSKISGIQEMTTSFYDQLLEHYGMKRLNSFKTISFIGNSMGGLVAIQLSTMMPSHVKLDRFITAVTPFHGLVDGDDGTWINKLRITIAHRVLGDTGRDLLGLATQNYVKSYAFTLEKFSRRATYVCSTFDLMVPYRSASMGYDLAIDPNGMDIYESRRFVGESLEWFFYTVPIHSLKNHGNVIGKHRDSVFTFSKCLVQNSIDHIVSNFK